MRNKSKRIAGKHRKSPEKEDIVIDLTNSDDEDANAKDKEAPVEKRKPAAASSSSFSSSSSLTWGARLPEKTKRSSSRRKSSTKGKKKCNLGKTCPYQDEYQHGLEYYHREEEIETGSPKKGKKKANKNKEFIPFQGTGHRLC